MTKPSDFYVGVIEFFGVLLPGAAFAYLLRPLLMSHVPAFWLPADPIQGWAMFLVSAYIAGHVLHGLGSWLLDHTLYGNFYLPRWQPSHARVSQFMKEGDRAGLQENEKARNTLLARVYLETAANPQGTSTYDWCLSAVRMQVPHGASEVDRVQADSKFFRSMVFVFLAVDIVWLWQGLWVLALGTILLTLFAAWRFCKLRWTATRRVYEYYLLLQDLKQAEA